MAEEAFALSPISASAAVPTDADYHAIREAFMETARGRWFLNEYAKRNRNADTAMVLEAVARIEQNLGAAHQEAATPQPPEGLPETMQAALEKARAAIRHEFSETGFDPALMPWRKSARIIREIVWGLRESGADPRICNILDGQARAIEAACDEFPLAAIRDRVLASLDALLPQDQEAAPVIAESTSDEHAAIEITADAAPALTQAPETQPEAVVAETAVAEAPVAEAPIMEAAVAEAVTAKIEAAMDIIAPASPEAPSLEAASLEDVASEVEALLEAAAEAPPAPAAAVAETPQPAPAAPAPRSIMTASASQPAPQPMAERTPAHDEPVSQAPVVATAASLPHVAPTDDPVPESVTVLAAEDPASSNDLWADIEAEIAPLPPFDPAHEDSLGASLIEQGVVARPSNGRADLLAPIRRMSHAERIAFFS